MAVWLGYALLWAPNVPPGPGAAVCAAAGMVLVWRGLHALADPERVLAEEAR
ncbi:hypothetical protein [Streptomonospora wellingtoniae]|uniref:Uncharacterized protein n=1 Tax=Streptomonospora wellingtoniae TaxID=3075544 RepID=A0ABU2KQ56_9ACTN|nr:hypothetical protein [Streptomonospora sp. DSM 45055]MDT0301346.1 hypothetical protein [Streptomonospora sp. DSM 45055]